MSLTPQYPELISEGELLATVLEMGQTHGWLTYHTRNSRGSNTGMPDLVLARSPDLLVFELKNEKGQPTRGSYSRKGTWLPGQVDWLTVLATCRTIRSGLWRPSDLGKIEEILR
jgi:hypothetical protein